MLSGKVYTNITMTYFKLSFVLPKCYSMYEGHTVYFYFNQRVMGHAAHQNHTGPFIVQLL